MHCFNIAMHEERKADLKAVLNCLQLLSGNFGLSSGHVGGLFGVKRISNASRNKNIKLNPSFAFLFFSFLFILKENVQ